LEIYWGCDPRQRGPGLYAPTPLYVVLLSV
jgi:hypothetical protein